MMKISVIIPVYNTEPWLRECLDSVLQQDYPDLEIICINDGSTDASFQILKEYANKDGRILFTTQTNHGPGYTRNRAIESASGDYILFLDSDDKLEKGFIQKITNQAQNDSLDLLCYDLAPFYESESSQKEHPEMARHHQFDYPGVYNGRDLFSKMRQQNDYFSAGCLALYRTAWLKSNQIYFPEGIFHEDEYFVYACFLYANRAGYSPTRGYLRRLRAGSTMMKSKSLIHVMGYYHTANLMEQLCYKHKKDLNSHPEFFDYALRLKLSASYIFQNNEKEIRSEAKDTYEKMVLEDLENYGSREELDAVYASTSWKIGNSLVQPLHFLKKLRHS